MILGKSLIIIAIFSLFYYSQDNSNYKLYHKKINRAEESIFVKGNNIEGLDLFEAAFKSFKFVYVDDCLEAFQLALYYKNNEKALFFIKKAIDNGFKIDFLEKLHCDCPHNLYRERDENVAIFTEFIKTNRLSLLQYQKEATSSYVKRLDTLMIRNIVNRHIKEQAYKQCGKIYGNSVKKQDKLYYDISNKNTAFIDSLFKAGKYLGEKNLGILDYEILEFLGISYLTNNYLDCDILEKLDLPCQTYVPVVMENDRSGINILYNILFHNAKSFQLLSKYSEDAIRNGFLHPREYASLMYNIFENGKIPEDINMHLNDYWKYIKDTRKINKMRARYFLPSYEIDYKKHFFAHKNCLKLSFGFANGTR